ncbi:hypothetical protein BC826DRAFT_1048438 [Russula brevipes]|nr:hypothetical protein BC826DRAFT_1048438 [Russula brevipes]
MPSKAVAANATLVLVLTPCTPRQTAAISSSRDHRSSSTSLCPMVLAPLSPSIIEKNLNSYQSLFTQNTRQNGV